MKALKRIDNWWWKINNRKPPTAKSAYLYTVGTWVFIGVMLTIVILIFSLITNALGDGMPISAFVIIAVFAMLILGYLIYLSVITIRYDKRIGLYKAIAEVQYDAWRKKAIEIGIKVEKDGSQG